MQDYGSMPFMYYSPPCMQNPYIRQAMAGMMPAKTQFAPQQTMPEAIPVKMPGTMPLQSQPMTGDPAGMPDLGIYTYPGNVPGALKLLQASVAGEMEDRLFYRYLIDNAPTQLDKEIITGIRDDEIGHFGLVRVVYYQLTGQNLPPPQEVTFEKPSSYCEGLMRAIRGEQNAVIRYRQILFALQDRTQINILTGIMTDEIRHGILYNYLYSKNGCRA
ncbi:MAG TPA: ferritin-like domain-containing protein [Clostridia bacterium]|nr:ferritin-like domain-containing protein [Clostridia bacterium]